MLDCLNAVEWNKLHTAFGSAEEIPQLITNLTRGDSETRNEALDNLFELIFHQGTAYDATPPAISCLLDIANALEVETKNNMISFLWMVASSWVTTVDNIYTGETLVDKDLDKSYQAIRQGLRLYLNLLSDHQPSLRLGTSFLLSRLILDSDQIVPDIMAQLRAETNSEVKSGLIWSLGSLIADRTAQNRSLVILEEEREFLTLIESLADPNRENLVSFAAAISLLKISKQNAPNAAINILISAIEHYQSFPSLPWDDVILWSACDALCKLDLMRGVSAFVRILKTISLPEDAHFVVSTLLGYTIKGKDSNNWNFIISYSMNEDGTKERNYRSLGNIPDIKVLTSEQKLALKAIEECLPFWAIKSNLLEMYGLPSSREQIRQLILK